MPARRFIQAAVGERQAGEVNLADFKSSHSLSLALSSSTRLLETLVTLILNLRPVAIGIFTKRWNDGQEVERVDAAQRGKRGSDRSNTIWKRGGDDSTPRGDHREVRYMDAEGDAREGERTKAETRPVFYWRRRAPAADAWCDENRWRSALLTETLRPRPTERWARRRNEVRFE